MNNPGVHLLLIATIDSFLESPTNPGTDLRDVQAIATSIKTTTFLYDGFNGLTRRWQLVLHRLGMVNDDFGVLEVIDRQKKELIKRMNTPVVDRLSAQLREVITDKDLRFFEICGRLDKISARFGPDAMELMAQAAEDFDLDSHSLPSSDIWAGLSGT